MANFKTNFVSFLILLLLLLHFFPLHATSHTSIKSPPSKPSNKSKTIPIVASVAAASFVLLLVIMFYIFRCLTKPKATRNTNTNQNHSDSRCRHFSISEIITATNNFDDSLIVGNGGFGNVYKGHIATCHSPVAIKRLKPGSDQGANEFQTEINMLSQLRHPHLVSLIGYCDDNGEMILVYDFMARGTLREHLYCSDSNRRPLDWNTRLEICLASARGIQFLHSGGANKQSVIHRDVKSTNILLDQNFVAKVSDFGLSRVGPGGSHVTTEVKGSFGYLDPEYYMSLWLTQKSDVYSFGVVMLEVLCGRPPIEITVGKHQDYLVAWVKKCCRDGKVDQTVDPALKGTIRPKCLKKYMEIALSCLDDHGKQRPLMKDVVKGLECAICLQQSGKRLLGGAHVEQGKKDEVTVTSLTEIVCRKEVDEKNKSCSSSSKATTATTCSEEEQALMYAGILSQLPNPTGR